MATTQAPRRKLARLTFEDGEVVVTPKDRSIFLISAEKATEACRDASQLEERIRRFESEFLFPLHDWCVANANRVRACYIPTPGVHIQVLVVTNNPQFDLDLGEKVAQLERQMAGQGWRVGILQLPNADDCSLATFFNADGALGVYAERGSAPGEGREQS